MDALPGLVVALQGGIPGPLPGPAPWGARQWIGAAVYVGLFVLALQGIRLLARGAPSERDGPS